eukprot:4921588-Amphidinium_carterae.1
MPSKATKTWQILWELSRIRLFCAFLSFMIDAGLPRNFSNNDVAEEDDLDGFNVAKIEQQRLCEKIGNPGLWGDLWERVQRYVNSAPGSPDHWTPMMEQPMR